MRMHSVLAFLNCGRGCSSYICLWFRARNLRCVFIICLQRWRFFVGPFFSNLSLAHLFYCWAGSPGCVFFDEFPVCWGFNFKFQNDIIIKGLVLRQRMCYILFVVVLLKAGGKPSTWLPPGGLVGALYSSHWNARKFKRQAKEREQTKYATFNRKWNDRPTNEPDYKHTQYHDNRQHVTCTCATDNQNKP